MYCKRLSLAALRNLLQGLRSEGALGHQAGEWENFIFSAGSTRPVQALTCLREFTTNLQSPRTGSAAAAAGRKGKAREDNSGAGSAHQGASGKPTLEQIRPAKGRRRRTSESGKSLETYLEVLGKEAVAESRREGQANNGKGDADDTSAEREDPAVAALVAQLPPYAQLAARARKKRRNNGEKPITPADMDAIQRLLRGFQRSGEARDKALAIYVNAEMWKHLSTRFIDFLVHVMDSHLAVTFQQIAAIGERELFNDAVFPYFIEYVLDVHADEVKAYRSKVESVDLRYPWQWYPVARALERRLIYHAGPTNSGKTHNALQAFKAAGSGLYCGPLRLLAMEVYDRMNAEGTYCNLATGQEIKEVPGANHTSCTIEMVPMNRHVDVAVVDEVQMIGDETRGWAWTRALQGLAANEVHLCGDGSALPLVRGMARAMREPLEVRHYTRFTPLTVESGSLPNGYLDVQPGDCIVAFSRRDIFDIKALIEKEKGYGVCVVYGGLPPEMRRQQARLFNEEGNEYQILVASDAVGMGLNLNIRRIIFHRMDKFEGQAHVPISVSQIKQIAGRAGRRGSLYPTGIATTLNPDDLPRLQEALDTPLETLTTPRAESDNNLIVMVFIDNNNCGMNVQPGDYECILNIWKKRWKGGV